MFDRKPGRPKIPGCQERSFIYGIRVPDWWRIILCDDDVPFLIRNLIRDHIIDKRTTKVRQILMDEIIDKRATEEQSCANQKS